MMLFRSISLISLAVASHAAANDVIVAVGAPGAEKYKEIFLDAAAAWQSAAAAGGADVTTIGLEPPEGEGDIVDLEAAITSDPENMSPLWVVLIGHGTYDGREAKFNLRGRDLTDVALSGWLGGTKRPVAVINSAAASGPFIKTLSGENRVIITATKSASEDSFARFGQFVAMAIDDPEADIDGDGGTSLLEAFLKAAEGVSEFYEKEGRLATEQALVDDNGDGLGTPASWFRGTRAIKKTKDGARPDGERAHQLHLRPSEEERRLSGDQRRRRDALEVELFILRAEKGEMDPEEYYTGLERIARSLAEIYGATNQ